MGGSCNLSSSIGHSWQRGPINSPTVLNSSMNVAQFWDGRAKDLKEQARGPIANPGEMAFTHELAIDMLAYRAEFKKAFKKESLNIEQVTLAIAAFEETLVPANSRFDQWLEVKKTALSKDKLARYQLFKSSSCVPCHNGVAVGGNSFQKLGVVSAYKESEGSPVGRSAVTGNEVDRFNFKVPTLRNVALTYPYLHDGAANTLTEAVDIMGRLQLGRKFNDDENAKIVAFLKTLTGDQPRFTLPILPPSSDSTPRPMPFDK